MFSPSPTRFQGGEKTDILMPRMPVTHQHSGFRLCVTGTSTPAFSPGQHSPHNQRGGEQNNHPQNNQTILDFRGHLGNNAAAWDQFHGGQNYWDAPHSVFSFRRFAGTGIGTRIAGNI
jgi:hypothetical protein